MYCSNSVVYTGDPIAQLLYKVANVDVTLGRKGFTEVFVEGPALTRADKSQARPLYEYLERVKNPKSGSGFGFLECGNEPLG